MQRQARHERTVNRVVKKRFPVDEIIPSEETLLMIQLATDMGYAAYWAGDRAKFGDCPSFQYEMIENLISLGWTRELDV